MDFNPDKILNLERRTGVKDDDINAFNDKVDAVNAAIKGMMDGTLDPKDVKIAGIDTDEEKAAKEAARAERLRISKEKEETLRLQRKKEEKDRWWNGAELMRPNKDEDADKTAADSKGDSNGTLTTQGKYDISYARWDTWVPNDEATLQEAADEEKRQDDVRNKEFENVNKEFCTNFIDDMKKREENNEKKKKASEDARVKGNKFFKAKSYERASELYMESLKDGPWDVKTLTNLAQVHIKTKNYDDAMEFLSRTLYLEPTHVKALSRKAFIESERRQFEEALVTIEKALALEPSNLDLIDQAREIGIIVKEKKQEAMEVQARETARDFTDTAGKFSALYKEYLLPLVQGTATSDSSSAATSINAATKHLESLTKAIQSASSSVADSEELALKESIQLMVRKSVLSDAVALCKYYLAQKNTSADAEFDSSPMLAALASTLLFVSAAIDEQRSSKLVILDAKLISAVKPLLKETGRSRLSLALAGVTLLHTCCKDDYCVKTRDSVFADKHIMLDVSSLVGNLSFSHLALAVTPPSKTATTGALLSDADKATVLSILSGGLRIIKSVVFAPGSAAKSSLTIETSSTVAAVATALHVLYCLTGQLYTMQHADSKECAVETLLGLSQLECMRAMFAVSLPFEGDSVTPVSVVVAHLLSWNVKPTGRVPEACRVSSSNCLATLMNACLTPASPDLPSVVQAIVDAGGLTVCLSDLQLSNADRRLKDANLLSRKAGLLSRLTSAEATQKKLFEKHNYRMLCRRVAPVDASVAKGDNEERAEQVRHLADEHAYFVRILAALVNPPTECRAIGLEEKVVHSLLAIFPEPRKDCGEVTPETVCRMPDKPAPTLLLGNAARCLMAYADDAKAQAILYSDDSVIGVQKVICAMATCTDMRVRRNIAIILAKGCKIPGIREKISNFRGMQMMVELQDKL